MKEHNHPNNRKILNRISRAIGHAESVKKMIEEEQSCDAILIQLSAVKSAFNNIGKLILQDHINHCIVQAIEDNDNQPLEKLNKAIDKFIK